MRGAVRPESTRGAPVGILGLGLKAWQGCVKLEAKLDVERTELCLSESLVHHLQRSMHCLASSVREPSGLEVMICRQLVVSWMHRRNS